MVVNTSKVCVMATTQTSSPAGRSDVEELFQPSGWLLQAENALATAFDEVVVAPTGYPATIVDLLVRLRFAPDNRLRGVDLTRQLLKSPGYVSRVIDQAESAGLVERRPDPTDRRAQQVVLTEAGNRVLDDFIPGAVEVLQRTVYSVLDDDEVDALVGMLRRISAAAQDVLASAPRDRVRAS